MAKPIIADRVAFYMATAKDGPLTHERLARMAGVSRGTISQILDGRIVSPRYETLEKIATAFGCTVDELTRHPPKKASFAAADNFKPPPVMFDSRATMPVYSGAEGGQGSIIIDYEALEHVPRPYTLENIPDAYAILIVGESMLPAYEPGDKAWVNPRLPTMRDTNCIFYAVPEDGADARAMIKRLVAWTDTEWTVKQWNPLKTFKLKRAEWPRIHRVVGRFERA